MPWKYRITPSHARRSDDTDQILEWLAQGEPIPATTLDIAALCARLKPAVLVDARMRKHTVAEMQLNLAPFTIGIGPGFVAGETTHVVIESSWGEDLGRVIRQGNAAALAGSVREIAGYGAERMVYAPVEGLFRTRHRVGDPVVAGETVGHIDSTPIPAPLTGRLRGLTRCGVFVPLHTKIVEIDPRGDQAQIYGLGERPLRIAAGVLDAVRERFNKERTA